MYIYIYIYTLLKILNIKFMKISKLYLVIYCPRCDDLFGCSLPYTLLLLTDMA